MSHRSPNQDAKESGSAPMQFGMLEILMLVTASALALWSYDQTLIFETSRPLKSELWKGILKGKILISFALSLTGAMLLVECIVKRRRFILQPGHVFLCCYGVTSLLFIFGSKYVGVSPRCLLYTSDAADE